ncbi:MAG TPA: hypothetical protein VLJ37_12780 [bacterium]|nr:hypothetical protein [bacterium]
MIPTAFTPLSLQTAAQEAARVAMPCVPAAPALAPGILAVQGGDGGQGGGGDPWPPTGSTRFQTSDPTSLGMPSSWGEAALSRYGIDQAGLLRCHKKELALRTVRVTALWSAIAVFPRIVPVAREVYESCVIGALFLSFFWTAWASRWLPEERQDTFDLFEAAERRAWEVRQTIESCQNKECFLRLKEEFARTVKAMERILAGSPERRFLRHSGLGHVATLYEVLMLALGHPVLTYDYPVLAAIAERNKSFLKRLPAAMPLKPLGPYRRT